MADKVGQEEKRQVQSMDAWQPTTPFVLCQAAFSRTAEPAVAQDISARKKS
jgi:hypothetical protein